jgi:DNA-binding response OmpR family regulator
MKEETTPHTVVLVEDDHDACTILKHLLSLAGYNVLPLNDGRQILETDFARPDLFILDISLPMIDGVALCKYLKLQNQTKGIPVIVLSGNHQVKNKALRAGQQVFWRSHLRSSIC